jgi:hypothetical protein
MRLRAHFLYLPTNLPIIKNLFAMVDSCFGAAQMIFIKSVLKFQRKRNLRGVEKKAGSILKSPLALNDASKDYDKSSVVLRSWSEDWPRTSPKAQMIPSDGFATERSIWLA